MPPDPATSRSPEDDGWLLDHLAEAAFLPAYLRTSLARVFPHLPPSLRYEVAAVLWQAAAAPPSWRPDRLSGTTRPKEPAAAPRSPWPVRARPSTATRPDRRSEASTDEPPTAASTAERRAATRRLRSGWRRWFRAAGPWGRWTLALPLLAPAAPDVLLLLSTSCCIFRAAQRVNAPWACFHGTPCTYVASAPAGGHTPARTSASAPERGRPAVRDPGAAASEVLAAAFVGQVVALASERPSLVVLDLPPELGVQAAGAAARAHAAWPVLVLGRWPDVDAVLPSGALVARLLTEPLPRLDRGAAPASAALVLDGERLPALEGRSPLDPRVDNRFDLTPADLPDAGAVRTAVERVVDVRLAGTRATPGLATAYVSYRAAGLEVVVYELGLPGA